MSEVVTSSTFSESEPSGISGWLLLPAVTMIFSPLSLALDFYLKFIPILKPTLWFALLSTKSTIYNPPLALLMAWQTLTTITLFVCAIWLSIIFFKKQKRFPKLSIAMMIFSCTVQLAYLLFSSFVPIVAAQQNDGTYNALAKSVIVAAIWIPYFLISKRVKNTFVNETEIKQISIWH